MRILAEGEVHLSGGNLIFGYWVIDLERQVADMDNIANEILDYLKTKKGVNRGWHYNRFENGPKRGKSRIWR